MPTYIKPRVIPDFITEDERKYIMDKARPKLQASTVDKNFRVDPNVRVSETAWLDLDDPVVQNVVRRCLKLTDRPMTNCEKAPGPSIQTGWTLHSPPRHIQRHRNQ